MDKSWKKMDNTVMGKNKDFHTNAVCKFFNKKSVQIVEANSHISG
ncbi:hypothetical protein C8D82_106138 [Victivallis vadensis]|uniref:Uncharacterized protein n=1 Tax=Victivallis vadensis TaxID=172901 RepID=A0A2U1B7I0_9BACT|nr:hypothetical protein C8D82_106138 [Victivallis vadensis]